MGRELATLHAAELRLERSYAECTAAAAGERESWWSHCNALRWLALAREEREAAWEAYKAVRHLRRWRR